ncbi:MAG: SpoIIE family protein phosphatase [Acetatifactor sp.]
MTFILDRKREEQYSAQISDLCRQRLLGYAETFQELARSFDGEFAAAGNDRQSLLDARKSWESRQLICSNLNEMAQIMTEVAKEVFHYQPLEEKKRRMLLHALRAEGIFLENICYIPNAAGKRALGVTMFTEKKGGRAAQEVADMLSVLLKQQFELSVSSPYLVDRTSRNFIFVGEARFVALTGFAKAVKENESISGDNYSMLESERGRLTVILSDGTGSGEQACKDSEKALDLLEKLLEAGYGIETAVNLVNSALFAGGEEQNHPTLDICDMDLYEGKCAFCKVGGAASFLKRENQVEQIEAGSLPLGIFQTVQTQVIYKTLCNGDYIVMMSDGVLDALGDNDYEEAMWEAISEMTEQNPKVIAEKLLQMAICAGGGHIQDDMTILVVGVWEKHQAEEYK